MKLMRRTPDGRANYLSGKLSEAHAEIARLRADNDTWKASHEAACEMVSKSSLSTGHAATPDELMTEVLFQLEEVRAQRDYARAEVKRLREELEE